MSIYLPYRYLWKENIENEALDILDFMPKVKWPLDPTTVAEYLGLDTEIIDLPLEGENDIAAMILPMEKKILVNENSEQLAQGFESSCIAHEIGHWALHIDHHGVEKQRILGLDSCRVEPLHKMYRKNIQDRIEWQAQYFAGCLLMPRYKLEEGRRGRDLTNWKHLAAMAHELGVTKSNLTYRLKDLGWIHIPKGSKRIYIPIVVSG